MNEVDAVFHLPRDWRYQFQPSTFNADINSSEGVAQTGYGAVTVSLPSDALNEFEVSPTTTGTIVYYTDIGLKEGWLFSMDAGGFAPFGQNVMWCVVNSVSVDTMTGETSILFSAYQSLGEGTYNSWYIQSDLRASLNFVQNDYYSAVAAKDRKVVPTARFIWPTGAVGTFHLIADTDLFKAGYYTSEYGGTCTVYEDQYDYNRPYEGITLAVTRKINKTVTTTEYTYDPPDSTTTIVVTAEPDVTKSYPITAASFDPASPDYYAGSGAPDPTPSFCINVVTDLGSMITSEYAHTYEAWYPGGPGTDPEYRITQTIDTTYEFNGDGEGTITPTTFFPTPG